jgi:2-oxoisovalerate dehydrogenase E1 component
MEQKDPIKKYEDYLLGQRIMTDETITGIRNEFKEYIEEELKTGFASMPVVPDTEEELEDIYATSSSGKRETIIDNSAITHVSPLTSHEKRFIDAIRLGLYQSMEKHSNLILMGQDIAEYGGAFKITEGFVEAFGKDRVRNTPICESAIVGAALGLSLEGYKSMMEMQFADFVTVGFNQVVNNLAKIHYRWGQNADVVIRMPTGGGVGAGPFIPKAMRHGSPIHQD